MRPGMVSTSVEDGHLAGDSLASLPSDMYALDDHDDEYSTDGLRVSTDPPGPTEEYDLVYEQMQVG